MKKQKTLDFLPAVKGKKQITSFELREFLKDKIVMLSCGHKYRPAKGLGTTMLVYADGTTNCHE